jgi:hypothetical protein
MGGDIAEEVQGIGCEAGLVLRGYQRAFSQPLRLVEPTEQAAGSTGGVIGRAMMGDHSSSRLIVEELFCFLNPF